MPGPIHLSFDQVLPSAPSFCFVPSPHSPPFLFHLLNAFFPFSQTFIPVGSVSPTHTPLPPAAPSSHPYPVLLSAALSLPGGLRS